MMEATVEDSSEKSGRCAGSASQQRRISEYLYSTRVTINNHRHHHRHHFHYNSVKIFFKIIKSNEHAYKCETGQTVI